MRHFRQEEILRKRTHSGQLANFWEPFRSFFAEACVFADFLGEVFRLSKEFRTQFSNFSDLFSETVHFPQRSAQRTQSPSIVRKRLFHRAAGIEVRQLDSEPPIVDRQLRFRIHLLTVKIRQTPAQRLDPFLLLEKGFQNGGFLDQFRIERDLAFSVLDLLDLRVESVAFFTEVSHFLPDLLQFRSSLAELFDPRVREFAKFRIFCVELHDLGIDLRSGLPLFLDLLGGFEDPEPVFFLTDRFLKFTLFGLECHEFRVDLSVLTVLRLEIFLLTEEDLPIVPEA